MDRLEPIKAKDVRTGPHVTAQESARLENLVNAYRDCFAACDFELGSTSVTEMKMKTVAGSKPVSFSPYRLAYDRRPRVNQALEELKEAGIVCDSSSEYASPLLAAKKKTRA
ncbi:hypothetical protein HPB47_004457, partial [Ixodes persulcatus]